MCGGGGSGSSTVLRQAMGEGRGDGEGDREWERPPCTATSPIRGSGRLGRSLCCLPALGRAPSPAGAPKVVEDGHLGTLAVPRTPELPQGSPWEGEAPSEHPFSPQSKALLSPSSPADDSYEDAEPLSPGRCAGSGERPTTRPPQHPRTPSTLTPSRLSGDADTDSSHYESYGEDEDGVTDRAHYLGPDAEPPGRPEAQLCGFLWRKRWLGQWAKQLFIIREHVLLVSGGG